MSNRDLLSDAYDTSLSSIFAQLTPDTVEQFYQGYQQWRHQQQIIGLQTRMRALKMQIQENEAKTRCLQPSPIALATLARLQSYGVTDLDLLDRMLERGDEWLDNTMQLLEQCERMDIIRDDYTHWCIHALEDAYDWIASIGEEETQTQQEPMSSGTSATTQGSVPHTLEQTLEIVEETESVTEEQFLQKLMSEADEETVKMPAIRSQRKPVASDTPAPAITTAASHISTVARAIPIPGLLSYPIDLSSLATPEIPSPPLEAVHTPASIVPSNPIPIPGLLSYPIDLSPLLPTPETRVFPVETAQETPGTPSSIESDVSLLSTPSATPPLSPEVKLPLAIEQGTPSLQEALPAETPQIYTETRHISSAIQDNKPQMQQVAPRKRGFLSKFLASLWSD